MAAAGAWLACVALALCACSACAHVHGAPRLAAVAGAAPDATNTSKATGNFFMNLDAPTAAWNITLRGVRASDVLTPSIHLAPTANATVGPEVVPLTFNSTGIATQPDGSVVLQGQFGAADYVGPFKGQGFDAMHRYTHEGQVYVVVPTKQHPAGEIKGAVGAEMLSDD